MVYCWGFSAPGNLELILSIRGRAIGLDSLIRLQEELHVYIGEQGEPKGPGQPGGGA